MSQLSLELEERVAYFSGKTFNYKDQIRAIAGSKWSKKDKRWEIPLESVEDAMRILPNIGLSQDVQKAVHGLRARKEKVLATKVLDDTKVPTKVQGMKGNLYPYQAVGKAFLDTLEDGEGAILGFDMGLGKSLTALATFVDWKRRGIVDYLLVVCPSPLKYSTWKKEVEKWTDLEYIVIDGDRAETVEWEDGTTERLEGRKLREVQYQQWAFGTDVTIMNYELFQYDYEAKQEVVTWVKERTLTKEDRTKLASIAKKHGLSLEDDNDFRNAGELFLKAHKYDLDAYQIRAKKRPYIARKEDASESILPNIDGRWMVVLDEAHRIKNPKAQTTKNLIAALNPAGRKVLGTGTPLENNVQELWSLVDFCRPGLLGNYYKFQQRYLEVDYYGSVVAPKAHMMPELKERIAPIMLRKTKQEAMPDLPPLTVQNYQVKMTKEQRALYNDVKTGILHNLESNEYTYLETLAQLTRLQQVCDSPALLRPVLGNNELPEDSGKLRELENIIRDINPDENKFILFSQYREMTDILYKWLVERGLLRKDEIGYIKGGMKSSDTERVQTGFQTGGIKCVLMTTAGNYGLDLSRGKYVICYDQLFNPQKMNQIYARAHRNGVLEAVTAINLVAEDSYEMRKLQVLESKRELFAAMVDADDSAFEKLFSKEDLINML